MLRALGSEEFKDSDIELSARLRASLHRYSIDNGLLCYRADIEDNPCIAVPHDEKLKYRILYEAHDTAFLSGHLGREKTYSSVSQAYWWPKLYKWVSTYVRTCETCQRVKPSIHAAAPLASLPVPLGVGSSSAWTLCLVYRSNRVATRVLWSRRLFEQNCLLIGCSRFD